MTLPAAPNFIFECFGLCSVQPGLARVVGKRLQIRGRAIESAPVTNAQELPASASQNFLWFPFCRHSRLVLDLGPYVCASSKMSSFKGRTQVVLEGLHSYLYDVRRVWMSASEGMFFRV